MKNIYYKGQLVPVEDWDFNFKMPKSEIKYPQNYKAKVKEEVTLTTEEIIVTEETIEE